MADSLEEARDIAAMNARVYAMSPEDREAWYATHPLSMFEAEQETVMLLLDGTDRSDAAILRAAREIMQRRFGLFTTDIQSGLAAAARHIDEQISSKLASKSPV
jgi:hypothetical protein